MLVVWLGLFALAAAQGPCAFSADNLKVEHTVNPIGITSLSPRLSWWATLSPTASDATNQTVSAYRIIVSSTPALAEKGVGDMWDVGPVAVPTVRSHRPPRSVC